MSTEHDHSEKALNEECGEPNPDDASVKCTWWVDGNGVHTNKANYHSAKNLTWPGSGRGD